MLLYVLDCACSRFADADTLTGRPRQSADRGGATSHYTNTGSRKGLSPPPTRPGGSARGAGRPPGTQKPPSRLGLGGGVRRVGIEPTT